MKLALPSCTSPRIMPSRHRCAERCPAKVGLMVEAGDDCVIAAALAASNSCPSSVAAILWSPSRVGLKVVLFKPRGSNISRAASWPSASPDTRSRIKPKSVEIGLGHTNAEIAGRLFLSEATVKTHVTHLFDKLAATN